MNRRIAVTVAVTRAASFAASLYWRRACCSKLEDRRTTIVVVLASGLSHRPQLLAVTNAEHVDRIWLHAVEDHIRVEDHLSCRG